MTIDILVQEILTFPVPVQNYITAIIVFLIVEMMMTWGFYG